MRKSAVLDLLNDELIPQAQSERRVLDDVDRWLRAENQVEQHRNQKSEREKRALADLSRTPLLRLIVEEAAQQMILEGVTSRRSKDTEPLWRPWENNGLPSREQFLYEAALGYGLAYGTALPGDTGAVLRFRSPRDLYCVYAEPAEDEWPMYGLLTIPQRKATLYRLIDEEVVHYLARSETGDLEYIEERPHGVGVTPIVRYANHLDLEGRSPGEVDKFKGVASRFEKTTNDRMLIQHHNSWRVKTATGLEEPGSPEEAERVKMLLRHEDILTGDENVTFGSLPETTLDSTLKAAEQDRDTLSAVAQTPVWVFNGGQLVNLAADALSEARSVSRQKINGKRRALGRSHAQLLRIAAHIEGRAQDAADFTLRMQWADVESRSMAQAADALGKIAVQLRVPVEQLWDMIPGISKTTADDWRRWARENPDPERMIAQGIAGNTLPNLG